MNLLVLDAYNDRPIAFNRHYVTIGCGITGALMLSQAVYWSKRTKDKDGWFYKTQTEWELETGLTRREQDTARSRLESLGVLYVERRGIPAQLFYKVDVMQIHNLLINAVDLQSESMHKSAKLGAHISQSTNTETTTDTNVRNSKNDDVETAFSIYWSAGMLKTNKKKALSSFASYVKANKLCPTEFANMLAKDVKARLSANQMGFDRMHPTTYLNGERWEDQIVQNHSDRDKAQKPVFTGQVV